MLERRAVQFGMIVRDSAGTRLGKVYLCGPDPMVAELGEVCWIVDANRQSLDRIVPNIGVVRLTGMFDAAGWQVLTVKYGRLLVDLFALHVGGALRDRIDAMSNPAYQRLLRWEQEVPASQSTIIMR